MIRLIINGGADSIYGTGGNQYMEFVLDIRIYEMGNDNE